MASFRSSAAKPSLLWRTARSGFHFARAIFEIVRGGALDLAEDLSGKRRPLTPPRRLWSLVTVRSNDFHASGQDLCQFLISRGLRPQHRVLDVGCGIGRLAVALTSHLDDEGSYEGFDIMPVAIRWCQNITAAHPNFRFQLADVHSKRYQPKGRVRASAYTFPYPDNSFDFVVLGSVFSHMLPDDLSRYLGEIARVLKPGGRSVISGYLLTPEKRDAIAAGKAALTFAHAGPGYWAENAEIPEAAVAYDQDWMIELYGRCGLHIVENLVGVWSTSKLQGQDIVIAAK